MNKNLTQEFDMEIVKEEYITLYGLIDSFDNKALTIKTWSVTVSMTGIGVAFLSHAPILLIFSGLSAVLFWWLESLWKSFQGAHYTRIEEIEAYCAGEIPRILPLQIYTSWERSYPYKKVRTFWGIAMRDNVLIPHLITFLAGILFYILHLLGIISV